MAVKKKKIIYNNSMKQNYLLIAALVLSMMNVCEVYASSSFPEFSLSSEKDSTQAVNDVPVSEINIKKQLTRDILFLQDQVNLLEAMVARQAEIQKIATSYNEINVPFTQPAPPLTACQGLPANILCFYSFPDLDMNKVFLNVVLDNVTSFSAPNNIDMGLSGIDISPSEALPQNEIEAVASYFWTDIQCLQNNCTAVIVKEGDNSDSIRVKSGDSLEDNLTIASISPIGVRMFDSEKNSITIKPLNTNRQINQNLDDESEISRILDNNAAELNVNESIPQPVITPPETLTDQILPDVGAVQPEVMSSSGLF